MSFQWISDDFKTKSTLPRYSITAPVETICWRNLTKNLEMLWKWFHVPRSDINKQSVRMSGVTSMRTCRQGHKHAKQLRTSQAIRNIQTRLAFPIRFLRKFLYFIFCFLHVCIFFAVMKYETNSVFFPRFLFVFFKIDYVSPCVYKKSKLCRQIDREHSEAVA